MPTAEPTEKYEFTKISVIEAARRLQINPQTIRRAMNADYAALEKDEHAPIKFPFGIILKGYGGDNIYMINGDAINRWLEVFKERSYAAAGLDLLTEEPK